MARARFVRALIWGNPVYAQTIGKILYENTTDDVRDVGRLCPARALCLSTPCCWGHLCVGCLVE